MMDPNPLAVDLDAILDHTKGLWDELAGQRIFITGGTGFFGCWLLESFLWANDHLRLNSKAVVLTRRPDIFRKMVPHLATHPAIELWEGDVRTFHFPPGDFPYIIHAATDASAQLNQAEPLLMLDTIVEGTRHTLDFARQCGAKKFLLTSSGAVYGRQPPELTHIPEEYPGAPDPCDPRSAYGEGKRAAELLCAIYSHSYGFETKIARCFAFVGPYLPINLHFAIGNFIRDALNGEPIKVNGDGTPYRSYLYAADLAIWLWTILITGESCRPYNVGSDIGITIADLANLIVQVLNPNIRVEIAQHANPSKPIQRYVPSVERCKKELGLEIWLPIDESLKKMSRWIMENDSWN
jgi:nucleoside-diphosphate-sugar epimerase